MVAIAGGARATRNDHATGLECCGRKDIGVKSAMAEQRDKNFVRGNIALAVGLVLALVGSLWAHFTGLPEVDDVGRTLYSHIPRGWPWVLLGQLVSLGGILIAMAGIALAYLYEKKLTWARASVGALLVTGLMMILYGVVPNEWLTYTQAEWEWTDQKLWIGTSETAWLRFPSALIGGNEVNISASAMKDIISGTYVAVITGVIAVVMIGWQKRDELMAKRDAKKAAKKATSVYGRPLQKVDG